ncbi:hypothetical protein RHSIM_Rhsim04G0022300 [Rhododendron simsii]|uniref:Uncharacterized protein n=1 Tax=Rhododendron simsii TaxID=118357 RepID=A0A834H4B9_RHOSS|nr:hypothetical protein RHSIM_Rhsim04G0022300 [Rhododendron simsii]
MESRRQKQKQLRKQASLGNYIPTKSRFRVEFECLAQNSDSSDHLLFNREILANPFHQSQLTNSTAARSSNSSSTDLLPTSVGSNTISWIATMSSDRSPFSHASKSGAKESVKRDKYQSVLIQQYGNSGRWRLITVVPELIRQVSRRKKDEGKDLNEVLREKKDNGKQSGETSGCSQRFFRSAVSWFACHAIEPARIEDA